MSRGQGRLPPKLSALTWGSECASSRPVPGGGIRQPPRRLAGLRCDGDLPAPGSAPQRGRGEPEPEPAEASQGPSWGAVPEPQKFQPGVPHAAPPDLGSRSTHSTPTPGRRQPAGGWAAAVHARWQCERQGQGQHRTREGQSGRRGARFPPGCAPAPTAAAARWGFRPARGVGAHTA